MPTEGLTHVICCYCGELLDLRNANICDECGLPVHAKHYSAHFREKHRGV